MRASLPRTLGSWTRQPLGTLWKLGELAGDYWAPPQMTLVPASTQFGRLEYEYGPLALLLTCVILAGLMFPLALIGTTRSPR